MGVISDLVRMKGEKDNEAKLTAIEGLKSVLVNPNATDPMREWAQQSLVGLLDGEFSGKKSKGGGGGGSSGGSSGGGNSGAGGGGGDKVSIFHRLIGGVVGGLKKVNPYTASEGTKQAIHHIQDTKPGAGQSGGQRMNLTQEEKDALAEKQEAIAQKFKLDFEEKQARQEHQRKLQYDQEFHERKMKEGQALGLTGIQLAEYSDPDKVKLTPEAKTTGTPRVFYGTIKGQEDQGPQIITFNPKDPSAGYVDASGKNYTKDEITGISSTPPQAQRLFGRPLEISQYVQSKGWKIGSPEYNYYFGQIAGADLQTSIGRAQQQGAIAGFESGIGIGAGFPAVPENPNKETKKDTAAPGAPGTAETPTAPTATKPKLEPRAQGAAQTTGGAVDPQKDRFVSMYLGSLMGDVSANSGPSRVGVIKGREAIKQDLGLGALDFSVLEAATKDQRKTMADTLQRAVAASRVNKLLDGFGVQVVERAKKLTDTGSPYLNKKVRDLQLTAVDNPDLRQFIIALNGFQRQYGVLTAGGTLSRAMLPISVGEKVDAILDPNATLGGVIASVEQVKQEGKIEQDQFRKQLLETQDDIRGGLSKGGSSSKSVDSTPSSQSAPKRKVWNAQKGVFEDK